MSKFYPEGWSPDPEAVSEILAQEPIPYFEGTPAAQVAGIPDHVYLWETYRKVTGKVWQSRDQGSVGSCVSFGTAAAIEATLASQILIALGSNSKMLGNTMIPDLVQEQIYGGSRVEIGNRKIIGDGSLGAWAAKCVQKYGVVGRAIYDKHDLREYDIKRCRQWGALGIPDDLEPECRKRIVKSITMVRDFDSAKQALASGYGISICSSRGFTTNRDIDGFCKPSGIWHHCMALIGYQTLRRPGGFIVNSWGPSYHGGPIGPIDSPPSGFWADASVIDSMLKQGDSWAFSAVTGFPAQQLDWR